MAGAPPGTPPGAPPGHAAVWNEVVGWLDAVRSRRRRQLRPAPICGMTLIGPSGCGKTTLIESLVRSSAAGQLSGVSDVTLLRPDDVYGREQPESYISAVFDRLASFDGAAYRSGAKDGLRNQDSAEDEGSVRLLVLDQLDGLCPVPPPDGKLAPTERAVVAAIRAGIDSLPVRLAEDVGGIAVLGATSRLHAVHHSLMRSDRLGCTIAMRAPSLKERKEMLAALLKGHPEPGLVDELARKTAAYVAADLTAVCQEAAMAAVREHIRDDKTGSNGGGGDDDDVNVGLAADDQRRFYEKALCSIRPTIMVDVPRGLAQHVSFDQLAGIETVIAALRYTGALCFEKAGLCAKFGVTPPRGVVLVGPAGVGKTALALALAQEMGVNVVPVLATGIRAKVVGEAEAALTALFQKARQCQPCVLLMDQIEALLGVAGEGASSQQRMVSAFATLVDSYFAAGDQLMIIATCRDLNLLDSAVRRPGRLDTCIPVALPDAPARAAIVDLNLRRMPAAQHLAGSPSAAVLVAQTDGLTGADIESVCREAAFLALRENVDAQTLQAVHLTTALERYTSATRQ